MVAFSKKGLEETPKATLAKSVNLDVRVSGCYIINPQEAQIIPISRVN